MVWLVPNTGTKTKKLAHKFMLIYYTTYNELTNKSFTSTVDSRTVYVSHEFIMRSIA